MRGSCKGACRRGWAARGRRRRWWSRGRSCCCSTGPRPRTAARTADWCSAAGSARRCPDRTCRVCGPGRDAKCPRCACSESSYTWVAITGKASSIPEATKHINAGWKGNYLLEVTKNSSEDKFICTICAITQLGHKAKNPSQTRASRRLLLLSCLVSCRPLLVVPIKTRGRLTLRAH